MQEIPASLSPGLILEDIKKQKWVLGSSICKCGFGEIYCVHEYTKSEVKKSGDYPYVVKVQPHDNRQLFCEMHVYMRIGKLADVETYKSLGMSPYFSNGSHVHDGENYRFIVLQMFGVDIEKLFLENDRQFPTDTVFKLGIQILDILEYIHEKSYVHGDILKGAKLLLGPQGSETEWKVHLVYFGLVSLYNTDYKLLSRRGDLEILVYNLIQWLGCVLPWKINLKNVKAVQASKEKYMKNLPKFLKDCFGDVEPPDAIVKYLQYIASLKWETVPDYKKLRDFLINGVETAGGSLDSQLKFRRAVTSQKRKETVKKASVPAKRAKLNKQADEVEEQSEVKDVPENGVLKTSNSLKNTRKKGVPKEVSNGNVNKIEGKTKNSEDGKKKKDLNFNDRILRPRRIVSYAEISSTEDDS